MRRMRDEKRSVFLKAKRRNGGAFEITPPINVSIIDGMELTLYAKPLNSKSQISRYTVGSGTEKKEKSLRYNYRIEMTVYK